MFASELGLRKVMVMPYSIRVDISDVNILKQVRIYMIKWNTCGYIKEFGQSLRVILWKTKLLIVCPMKKLRIQRRL